MKDHIGGLFRTQESANLAYEALQRAGFANENLHMFLHRPPREVARSMEVPIQEIARVALSGALILGAIGGFLGWLVGTGTLSIPYLEPGSAPRDPLFVFMSVVWGLIAGGLTGAILGAASRLLRSRERAEVMTTAIEKRGVLIIAGLDGAHPDSSVRRVMEEHGAVEIGNPFERWDPDAWWSPNSPSGSRVSLRSLAELH